MIRGIERSSVFEDDQDRSDFISRTGKVATETETRILAWALMKNHVHFLLFSGPPGIAKFMRRLLTGYAQAYNRKYRRSGHLFQNRYKSIVCEEKNYLLELVRYIHLNPLRASQVKNLGELDQYPWSGHHVLLGQGKNDWQERDYVLQQFNEKESKAILGYQRFMKEGKNQGRRPELVGGGLIRSLGGWSQVLPAMSSLEKMEHDDRILGGGDFVAEILRESDKNIKRYLRGIELKKAIEKSIEEICTKENIDEKAVRLGVRTRKCSQSRAKIAYRLCHEFGVSQAEIARQLGVCTSAIAKAIIKFEGKG
jgi:REP element-mobilizing transposase RayT